MNAVILDRRIRIGIADDNELVRSTLRFMIGCSPNIKVVGEAENGSEAIAMVEVFQPDVVLMDISMPVVNGIEATRSIMSNFPIPRSSSSACTPTKPIQTRHSKQVHACF